MIQTFLTYLLIVIYVTMAYYLFYEWLDFYMKDEGMDSEQKIISNIVLVVGSILWPIVLPFAYLEILKFHKKNKEIINFILEQRKK